MFTQNKHDNSPFNTIFRNYLVAAEEKCPPDRCTVFHISSGDSMVSSAPHDQHVATCNATSNNHLPHEGKLTFDWAVSCCDSTTARAGNATNRKFQTFEMGNKNDNNT